MPPSDWITEEEEDQYFSLIVRRSETKPVTFNRKWVTLDLDLMTDNTSEAGRIFVGVECWCGVWRLSSEMLSER